MLVSLLESYLPTQQAEPQPQPGVQAQLHYGDDQLP